MITERLENLGACREAIAWVSDSGLSLAGAWQVCPRGDWLLWYATRVGADHRTIVRCACEIARGVLSLVPAEDDRPRRAIEAAERWAEDPTEANRDTAVFAAAAADAAADAAYADAAAYAAAWAAARAAFAYASARATYAAAAAYAAAAVADAADASARSLAHSADIVRRHFPALPGEVP